MIWMLKHWRPLAAALVMLALVMAWQLDRARQYRAGHAAATAEISLAMAEQAAKDAEQARPASVNYQSAKAAAEQKERVRYAEVQKIIKQPVYAGDCVDADGLQLINAAVADGD